MATPNIIISFYPKLQFSIGRQDRRKKRTNEMVYNLRALCYLVAEQNGLWYLVNRNIMTMYFIFVAWIHVRMAKFISNSIGREKEKSHSCIAFYDNGNRHHIPHESHTQIV